MTIVNTVFLVIYDIVESMFLSIIITMLFPFSVINRFSYRRYTSFVAVLLKKGHLSTILRAYLDFRLSNFKATAFALDTAIRLLEGERTVDSSRYRFPDGLVLLDLYDFLAKVYLVSGDVESCASLVMRANSFLGVEKLPSIPKINHNTAQVLVAGYAASRLIEDGKLSFLMAKKKLEAAPSSNKTEGAKIIPFPGLTTR